MVLTDARCLLWLGMTSVDGKITYVTVEHHKVSVPTRPDHLTMREDMRQKRKGAEERMKLAKI
jgi:hypothetical protein